MVTMVVIGSSPGQGVVRTGLRCDGLKLAAGQMAVLALSAFVRDDSSLHFQELCVCELKWSANRVTLPCTDGLTRPSDDDGFKVGWLELVAGFLCPMVLRHVC